MDEERKCNLFLDNRKKLTLTGVAEVISYDDEKIELNTDLGKLDIRGRSLKINKLDVQNGDVIIVGSIGYIAYSNKKIKKSKQSILKKIFK